MRKELLPFSPPSITNAEIDEVVDTLRSGWVTSGPKVARFEQAISERFALGHVMALSSCTAALHTALLALDVGRGDAVITSTMTFAATANVIEQTGARPHFVDVDPDTLGLSSTAFEAALESWDTSERAVAVMPIHLYGHPCDLDAILDIARRHDLAVIEDAAHSLGARYKDRYVGEGSGPRSMICFSFYATKNLTTGEGGLLVLDQSRVDAAHLWSSSGITRKAYDRDAVVGPNWYYEVRMPGYKYNMTDIQAALGLAQLRRFDEMQERRREIANRYSEALGGSSAIQVPVEQPWARHAWHLYPIRLNLESLRIDRDTFIRELLARRISTSVHFIPLHLQPYYRERYGLDPQKFPVASREYLRLISLPLHPGLQDEDVEDVIEAVLDVAGSYGR